MKYLLLIPRLLYKVYFALVFFIIMILSYPIFKYWIKRGAQYDKVFQLEKKIALILQYMGLAPLKIESKSTFPPPPYIVLSNHTSYLDIVHMYTIIPDFYLFLGKSEILHWPIIKIFFKGMNIPVERGSIRASKKAQELADNKLKNGKCLMIYPEGGIFKGAPRVQKFKNGAFTLAINNNVPIVPVTFLNNWRIMDDSSVLWGFSRPGIAKAIVHESIDTTTMNEKDLISLRNKCKKIIEEPLALRYPKYF
jgi:1-acyl-sn-glycerol-3-phosphate acyltransferase